VCVVQGLCLLYLLPCQCGVQRGSVTPAWFRTTTIAEGGNLASEGGHEGVGGLLTAKGGGCNLDVGVCDSMFNQHEEEVPTVDICKSHECRPFFLEHAGELCIIVLRRVKRA
jgi:hypothetical protein